MRDEKYLKLEHSDTILTRVYTGCWRSRRKAFESDNQFRFMPLPGYELHSRQEMKERKKKGKIHTITHGE
jgi:hypothetical protein